MNISQLISSKLQYYLHSHLYTSDSISIENDKQILVVWIYHTFDFIENEVMIKKLEICVRM